MRTLLVSGSDLLERGLVVSPEPEQALRGVVGAVLEGLSYKTPDRAAVFVLPDAGDRLVTLLAAQGFRVAGFLFASLSVVATYLLGRTLVSARVGVVAAILLTAIPRYFFDAHLACFDVPITAMWTLSIFFFVRAYRAPPEKVVRFAVEAGLVWGLGLATKLNALFLPAVFVFLWFIAPPESLRPRLLRNLGGNRYGVVAHCFCSLQ